MTVLVILHMCLKTLRKLECRGINNFRTGAARSLCLGFRVARVSPRNEEPVTGELRMGVTVRSQSSDLDRFVEIEYSLQANNNVFYE